MGTRAASQRVAVWLERKLPRLLRSYGIAEAYLFGSWARGEADADSDVDLILVTPSHRPFTDRFHDVPLIWQSAPGGIDLLIYTPEEFATHRKANRFLRHVLREARRLI